MKCVTVTLVDFLLPTMPHAEYVQFTVMFSVIETPPMPTAAHVSVVGLRGQSRFRTIDAALEVKLLVESDQW